MLSNLELLEGSGVEDLYKSAKVKENKNNKKTKKKNNNKKEIVEFKIQGDIQ